MAEGDHHPSALRNRGPILEELRTIVPYGPPPSDAPCALEVASGTGAHIEVYAPAFPHLMWQPTEYRGDGQSDFGRIGNTVDPVLNVIDRHGSAQFPNVLPAAHLDASQPFAQWPPFVCANAGRHSLVMCSNVTHISPWTVTLGLVAGAAMALATGGAFVLYGPFTVNGAFTSESNRAFDASLRQRNPLWGYRDVAAVAAAAAPHGLRLRDHRQMPANNQLLWFEKVGPAP